MLEKALTSVSEMESAYHTWRNCPLTVRKEVISRIREKLLTHAEQYARAITTDMNKPLAQALAELKNVLAFAIITSLILTTFSVPNLCRAVGQRVMSA